MDSDFPVQQILECSHCGNKTPHTRNFEYEHPMFWDELEEKMDEPFTWLGYVCQTCGGLNIYGAFFNLDLPPEHMEQAKIHPRGADMLPPPHTMSPMQPVPEGILRLYREVWPLRHRAPGAFIGQVRRLLEAVCKQQGATGKDLFAKLKDLSSKGVFPGYFSQITDLLRKVGNMGAHANDAELSVFDAELIDDFFRSVVDYVYIAPARIKRMENRLLRDKAQPPDA
jgi:hypothetical protein